MRSTWVPGSACWAPDPERAFVEARVEEVKGRQATITVLRQDERGAGDAQRSCPVEELLPRCSEQRCTPDMDELQELNRASVLNNLELLFGQKQCSNPGEGPNVIYSSVGPTLIAMNPFVQLPLYGDAWIRAYRDAGIDERRSKELGPHCYRTVQEAWCRLRAVKHQSIVICGESGAGKTVTNKKMIEYLCQVARRNAPRPAVGADPEQITEANILLEAFGNAKTTRNDNSSRFGRYTRLTFDPDGSYSICGCHVDHYLLERSRVVAHMPTERSYHVFYHLLESGEGAKLGLKGRVEQYRYTRNSAQMSSISGQEEYKRLREAMVTAGFDEETSGNIFKGIAAVLLLGNVEFDGDADMSEVDVTTKASLEAACKLLGVKAEAMASALTSNFMTPPGGRTIKMGVSVETARGQQDTVAKTLYSRMFDYIVNFISYRLKRSQGGSSSGLGEREAVIGLLDIFGFEDLAVNGFEQMFINLTNERIQHLFNSIMFERELEVYRKEGITTSFDPCVQNLACVRLFTSPSNPPGIVKLLSESAFMKTGRDGAAFVQVLNSTFANHENFRVCDPQQASRVSKAKGLSKFGMRGGHALDYRECFQVMHYAGTITYTVSGWTPKSIDSLLPHLSEVLRSSSESYVRELFDQEEALSKSTVGEKFCAQLESLAGTLETGETLFVRCIKSNPQMVPGVVNRKEVLEQLVHGGVIAALEMRHKGLPDRMDYDTFCFDYGMLEDHRFCKKDVRFRCERLLREVFGEGAERNKMYAFGRTKVFMKSQINAFLRAVIALRRRNVVKKFQRQWRIYTGTERIRKVEEAWQAFCETERLAKTKAVDAIRTVAQALDTAKRKIEPMMLLLEEMRAKHGTDVHKIGAALPKDRTSPLFGAVEEMRVAVERVVQRKAEAEQLLFQRLARAANASLKLAERVKDVLAGCEELEEVVDKQEMKDCLAACAAARARLDKLQNEELPELRRLGPVGVDLESEGELCLSESEISPKATELLEAVAALVTRAEELGHGVLRVRRAFQQAVQEVQGQQEEASKALEILHEPAKRCIAEGFSGIVEPVRLAWLLQAEAQELLQAAKDADGYRKAVEAFVASVREAQATVERGRELLAKRDAEREARRELQKQLDSLQKTLEDERASMFRALEVQMGPTAERGGIAEAAGTLGALLEELAVLRGQSNDELDEWRAKVLDMISRTQEAIDTLHQQLSAATKERQEEFNRRMQLFNNTPDKKKDDDLLDPASFVQQEGLGAHEDTFMEVCRQLETLKQVGVPRSGVQRCLNHFVKYSWGVVGAASLSSCSPAKTLSSPTKSNAPSVPTSPARPPLSSGSGLR